MIQDIATWWVGIRCIISLWIMKWSTNTSGDQLNKLTASTRIRIWLEAFKRERNRFTWSEFGWELRLSSIFRKIWLLLRERFCYKYVNVTTLYYRVIGAYELNIDLFQNQTLMIIPYKMITIFVEIAIAQTRRRVTIMNKAQRNRSVSLT